MYKDPGEFRERFKAYKDGKSVREIYGLPGYSGGKSSSAVDDTADFLRQYEGFKEKTYLDGKGIPTIGYGFTDAKFVNKGRITRAEAEIELKRQIAVRQAELRRKLGPQVWDSLSNDSKKALTSYHFNYPAGFKDNTKFMQYWRAGRYSDAIKEVDAGWNDPDNPGLRTRRIAEQKLLRSDPALFSRPISEKPSDVTIQRPDILRVATTIPQEKTIPIADPRNATIAEAQRAMWAHTAFENMPKVSDMPIWESPSLPALEPIELDVTPFKYNNGKLPGYQLGKAKAIQQGHKQITIDKAEAATEPDYNEGWFLTTIKRGVNNAIKTVKDQVRAARNIINGRGTLGDYIEIGIDALTGAAGKLLSGSAKEAKQVARRTLKPTKASTKKFDTRDPNKVGAYYSAHPEEVTPIINNPEVKEVVNFMNNHIGPKYAKQNGVHIGIDPNDIKLGYADLSGSNLGGYVGPSGEVVINKDILNNRDQLRYVLGHEIAGHWFDQHYPLTVSQMSTVGYGMPFKKDFLAERPWVNAIKEANAERRAFSLMTYFDKGVLGDELDYAIKNMPRAEAKRYIDQLGYAKGIDWQWPDLLPFKQAVTSVPAAGAGIYLAGTEEYKDGKLPGYEDGKEDDEDLIVKETNNQYKWLSGWLQGRAKQMADNIDTYTSSDLNGSSADLFHVSPIPILDMWDRYRLHHAREIAKEQTDRVKDVPIYDLRLLGQFEKAQDMSYNLDNFLQMKYGTQGAYYKPTWHNKLKDEEIFIAPKGAFWDRSTPLHEMVHAATNEYQIQQAAINEILGGSLYYKTRTSNYKDKYLDDPSEVYSRLMQFRYDNKLTPNYKVTKKDLERWRKSKTVNGQNLINRYDDDVLLKLFNDVAMNNTDYSSDVLFAANGKLPGYKNGKIRIKPANRGKFNATKKRTGKTTEELTHSKNPLTRKRAIFAQNAKKWNHK